jgi:hypothetical protein
VTATTMGGADDGVAAEDGGALPVGVAVAAGNVEALVDGGELGPKLGGTSPGVALAEGEAGDAVAAGLQLPLGVALDVVAPVLLGKTDTLELPLCAGVALGVALGDAGASVNVVLVLK